MIKIVDLMNDKKKRDDIGHNGWKYIKEHHSWDVLNTRFEQSLLELV